MFMERHNQSFFGQKTAILFDSGASNDSYSYFRFIKKNDAGWERPSENGGKAIKLSIQELICILDVLNGEKESWNTVHKYNSETTSLSFACENRTQYSFKFSVSSGSNGYVKQIIYPESKFLRILLDHIIKEKIENATGYKPQSAQEESSEEPIPQAHLGSAVINTINASQKKSENQRPQEKKMQIQANNMSPMENVSSFISEIQKPEVHRAEIQKLENQSPEIQTAEIQKLENQRAESGRIETQQLKNQKAENQRPDLQEKADCTDLVASAKIITGKAVLLEIEPGNEFWVPKSAILKGNYDLIGTPTPFSIKSWVLKNRAINA